MTTAYRGAAMDTDKLVETSNVLEEKNDTDSGRPVETVKLVEMGPVSVETKGFTHGLEIGFTPRG
jgi:hypothetical protein